MFVSVGLASNILRKDETGHSSWQKMHPEEPIVRDGAAGSINEIETVPDGSTQGIGQGSNLEVIG